MCFRIEAAVRAGYNKIDACTSKLCTWNVPPQKTKVKPMRVKDMNFKASKFSKVPSRPLVDDKRRNFKPIEDGLIAEEEKRQMFCDGLKEILPNGCFMAFVEKLPPPVVPDERVVVDCTTDMSDVIVQDSIPDPDNLIIKLGRECSNTKELLDRLPILSVEEVNHLETLTVGQSENTSWKKQRKCRITASNFYSVFTKVESIKSTVGEQPNVEPLLSKLMQDGPTLSNIPAVKHGQSHEPVAKKSYISLMEASHKDFNYRECGLIIDSDRPYLGASPDLLISCSCCGQGVLEIKCPYSMAQEIPSSKNLVYLENDTCNLKKKHAYFAQVQGQMAISKRNYCDFFVFTHAGHCVERLYLEDVYWRKILVNLEYFFCNHLAPEIIKYSQSHVVDTTKQIHEVDATTQAHIVDTTTQVNVVDTTTQANVVDKIDGVIHVQGVNYDNAQIICPRCNLVCKEEDEITKFAEASINCDCCDSWYHTKCAGFRSKQELQKLGTSDWLCVIKVCK